MLDLTIIKKSKVENLQAQVTTEKLSVGDLTNKLSKLKEEYRDLRYRLNAISEENVALKEGSAQLMKKLEILQAQNKYLTKSIADNYAKYRKERDEKGRFIKKQS